VTPDRARVLKVIETAAGDAGLDHQCVGEDAVVVALPGEQRLKTACWLTVGAHALEIQAFVLRKPEENREELYGFLLQRNPRQYGVFWGIDALGDIYLTGKLPLAAITAEEVDRIFGSVLEYADGLFNRLLELGFGSSIRREWAWRVKNGESLANLKAFESFASRPAD
jgi:hypothetical protein